jgi:Ser/Thr protein kinase RdoA (MazF antagonist)
MYEAMGRLHAATRSLDLSVPRPTLATYGPPRTLRRWMTVTQDAVENHPEARKLAVFVVGLLPRLAAQWLPASQLPVQLVHGDVRLGNVAVSDSGSPAYLDFGFAARRPRIHELAYSLSWVLLRPDDSGTGADFDWPRLHEFIEAYEQGASDRLNEAERACLGAYVASIPLYLAAISGYTPDPSAHLVGNERFIRIAAWVLDHPPQL